MSRPAILPFPLIALLRWCGFVLILMPAPLAAEVTSTVSFELNPPTFDHHVMPVLSKAGCNLGTCHGNFRGKGDFRLSLRGQDPQADYLALTSELGGRRINRQQPAHSLMLMKPAADVPHVGGQRFTPHDLEYQILKQWIAQGMPAPQSDVPTVVELQASPERQEILDPDDGVQLTTIATFSDGSRHNVSALTTFETTNFLCEVDQHGYVQRLGFGETIVIARYINQQVPIRLAFLPSPDSNTTEPSSRQVRNYIDQHVFAKLDRLRVPFAGECDDRTFLRRVYVDVLGRLPTVEEARSFLEDPDAEKRMALIDRLLQQDEFADHWALKWSDLLRNEEKLLDAKGVDLFYQWIRHSIQQGKPLNQFVHELVASRGSTYDSPAANYYRSLRDPLERGETTAQLFLGVRLQCAKCHNHPFDVWTQDDYYSWAALFARVDYEIVENNRKDKFDKHEFQGEQIVVVKEEGEVQNVRTGQDARPQYLSQQATTDVSDQSDRLLQLADWLTSDNNPAFAKVQVNRIWYQLMGQGLVDPVDDFRITNPASHPELLMELTDDFIRHRFDLRHLVRTILNSAAYQSAPFSFEPTELQSENYAGTVARRLTAEQLLDAQCDVLGADTIFAGFDADEVHRAIRLPGVNRVRLREAKQTSDDRFLRTFGKPERLIACECERSDETTLSQAFLLISGNGLQERLESPTNRLHQWRKADKTDDQIIEQFYWTALQRSPSSAEIAACKKLLDGSLRPDDAWQDIAWAVLNSKEFLFRQ
ncbi:MAG: DUF1549 and DUF1553 domain-containing protein [Pirellulaceae bacterium]